jgi:hypothetical protein
MHEGRQSPALTEHLMEAIYDADNTEAASRAMMRNTTHLALTALPSNSCRVCSERAGLRTVRLLHI